MHGCDVAELTHGTGRSANALSQVSHGRSVFSASPPLTRHCPSWPELCSFSLLRVRQVMATASVTHRKWGQRQCCLGQTAFESRYWETAPSATTPDLDSCGQGGVPRERDRRTQSGQSPFADGDTSSWPLRSSSRHAQPHFPGANHLTKSMLISSRNASSLPNFKSLFQRVETPEALRQRGEKKLAKLPFFPNLLLKIGKN